MKECAKCKKCGKNVRDRYVDAYLGNCTHSVVHAEGDLCHRCWCAMMEAMSEAVRGAATRFCEGTDIDLELGNPDVGKVHAYMC
jgi:hypothetical protein